MNALELDELREAGRRKALQEESSERRIVELAAAKEHLLAERVEVRSADRMLVFH